MANLGLKLYELRKKAKISQEEFAEIVDTSRQAVSKWERDESEPELNKIILIAKYYNVSIDYLLDYTIDDSLLTEYLAKMEKVINEEDFSINYDEINDLCEKLNKLHYEVTKSKNKYQVVFFPYKAAMWDSLESIWLAAMKDVRCECLVVPIPYYKKSQDGGVDEFCYEGQKFPEYVPIIDYREYLLEEDYGTEN